MSLAIVLDAGPVGLLCHRRKVQPADECKAWFRSHAAAGTAFFIPEIVDYEVRRELLRLRKTSGLRRLDLLSSTSASTLIPITSACMRRASELWAEARQQGHPTADPKELDADVILAAQVLTHTFTQSKIVIAITNPGHLGLFHNAADWQTIR